jgi:NADH-quinone oxidoreductase subunit L
VVGQAEGGAGFTALAWIVVVLPLVAFFVITLFGKRFPGRGAEVGIAAVGIGFLISVGVLLHFVRGGGPSEDEVQWFSIGGLEVHLGQFLDGLTAVMLVVVTLVSLCVQVYSIGYMHGDSRFTWFFAVLSLFTGAMLDVVVANNLFQLLVGWEIMGVSSYLLIGHWWEEKENSNAAIKAFITTRIGDVPFVFGIFVLTVAAGTANIPAITELAEHGEISSALLTAGALLLFGGASTSGCPTPWPAPRPSRPSSTRPPWSPPGCTWWAGCSPCSSTPPARS